MKALNNVAFETHLFVETHWLVLLDIRNLKDSLYWSVFNWVFGPHGHIKFPEIFQFSEIFLVHLELLYIV